MKCSSDALDVKHGAGAHKSRDEPEGPPRSQEARGGKIKRSE